MATYKHTGVGAATTTTDYARADQAQNSSMEYLSSVAGTDTITATATPTPAAYAAGQTFRFVPANNNTGAATINISSLGAKSITKNGTTALAANDLVANKVAEITYDGTRFQLANPAGGTGDLLASNNLSDVANASTARTNLGLAIGTDVQAYDADTLKSDTTKALTAGYSATPYNAGTKSSGTFTPDEANGNMQYAVNGGAHTLAPPTNNCTLVIQYTNNGSAGTITTSGFTKVSGSFTTTNGDDFLCFVTKLNGFSHLNVVALQ